MARESRGCGPFELSPGLRRGVDMARRIGLWGLFTAVLAAGSLWAQADDSAPRVPVLRVIATCELPGTPSTVTDIRWANDKAVYVARLYDGVDELALAPGLPRVRQLVPNRTILGIQYHKRFSQLAASNESLAFSDGVEFLTWRSLGNLSYRTVHFDRKPMDVVEDLDLAGDRLLVLGALNYSQEPGNPFAPDGAVAFLGSTRNDGTQELKPVLFDPEGRGARRLGNCEDFALGAARFLPDGSFFIIPGFQPGAHLFSPEGVELRSWNTALLGLDADVGCASLTWEARDQMRGHGNLRAKWLAQYRIVDEVLPLPSGPGLVIRSVKEGEVHWELDVLGAGGIAGYEIPIEGRTVYDRLRGDYRDGKIVLAVIDDSHRPESKQAPSKLVVLEFPKG